MPLPLAEFQTRLLDSGVLDADQVSRLESLLAGESAPASGDDLARMLVSRKLLTAYQAQTIYQGKGKHLVLGNYLVLDKLGQGGMGMVLKARHRRMDRLVALKVVAPALVKNKDLVARFHREVKAAARLSHPHIVTAYDADEVKGTHFLVMEYVDGVDLGSLVRQRGMLPVATAFDFVLQAARGLDYAHRQGVIHRDIKPGNLLLSRDGTVKILDMGLARIDAAGQSQGELTSTGAVMGTVDYMSPEQAFDSKSADARADQYSLGCTLFYLLTAQHVYAGESLMEKMLRHREAPIPSLRSVRPEVPPALDAIFQRLVAKNPADRYGSMAQLVDELTRLPGDGETASPAPRTSPDDNKLNDFLSNLATRKKSPGTALPTRPAAGIQTAVEPELYPGQEVTVSLTAPLSETQPPVASPTATLGPVRTLAKPAPRPQPPRPSWRTWRHPPAVWLAIGSAVVLLLTLAAMAPIVLRVETEAGTIILEVDQPEIAGAEVTIDGQKKITIKPGKEQEPIEVIADAKTHTLRVTKGGFETFTRQFTVKAGTRQTVSVRLEPKQVAATMPSLPLTTAPRQWPADAPLLAIAPLDAEQAKERQQEWATYLKLPVEHVNSIGMKFRLIPPGEFTMGMPQEEAEQVAQVLPNVEHWKEMSLSSAPPHRVRITQPYYLGTLEVTQQQYQQVAKGKPAFFSPQGQGSDKVAGEDTANYPAESVTYDDAIRFCIQLSEREQLSPVYSSAENADTLLAGNGYRLPSEAEWEYAGRAGTTTTWIHGDQESTLGTVAWIGTNAGGRTHPVGQLPANAFGMHDVHGNVWEWCQDWHDPQAYSRRDAGPTADPRGPATGTGRVMRGGSWIDFSAACSSAFRIAFFGHESRNNVGLRLALSVDAVRQAAKRAQSPAGPADAPQPAVAPFPAEQAKRHQDDWAAYLKVPVEHTNAIGMKLRLIPPGEFLMGSTQHELDAARMEAVEVGLPNLYVKLIESEAPQHPVELRRPCLIGKTEVTIGDFRRFVQSVGYVTEAEKSGGGFRDGQGYDPSALWSAPGYAVSDAFPVTQVTWNDCVAFCNWLSEQDNVPPCYTKNADDWVLAADIGGYRLLTEAEWEFACRAGTTTNYSFGEEPGLIDKFAWHKSNSSGAAHEVATRLPNAFGLYDMHGNVWEWCHDWFAPDAYTSSVSVDPLGPAAGTQRVGRGASWPASALVMRSAFRFQAPPSTRHYGNGFRVARRVTSR